MKKIIGLYTFENKISKKILGFQEDGTRRITKNRELRKIYTLFSIFLSLKDSILYDYLTDLHLKELFEDASLSCNLMHCRRMIHSHSEF